MGFFIEYLLYMESVGIIIIAKDTNRFFLLHRAKSPIVWSSLTGKMEEGEDPMQTIKREIKEEIGVNPIMIDGIKEVGIANKTHHVMVGYVDKEFKVPKLETSENDDYGWFDEETLPSPMHKRWLESFELIKPLLKLREGFKYNLNKLLNG